MPGLLSHGRLIAPLESDPAIFTTLLHALGAPPSYTFIDILSLSSPPPNILAAVLIAPWTRTLAAEVEADEKNTHNRDATTPASAATDPNAPIWLKQTLTNTCGFHALLHCILNVLPPTPDSYERKSFLQRLMLAATPDERRGVLEQNEDLERAYMTAAADGQTASGLGAAAGNHYLAFVETAAGTWELSGARWGAVNRGKGVGVVAAVEKIVGEMGEEAARVAVLGLVQESCGWEGGLAALLGEEVGDGHG
ncbi:ubiquitin carboxyl-terminal hydrolase [Geopyxis carbonaria]|nr:ubiquitin carboxyl-terminal hydrolase [Geopyxis carbonaria]